jgi:maltose alpha-D-glucosyltransferase/alpha-amylase
MPQPAWYKNAVFYEVYIRAFRDSNADGKGDLAGLTEKLDYLAELGIDCIWITPIYPSPLKDDGYDISDYCGVHPDFGNLEDFKQLVKQAHHRGLRLIIDLVVNHSSNQHPWFQAARADHGSPYHDYYVWSDSDQKYKEARIIFLDAEKSNWTWDEQAGQYYWHRFYWHQPDLNYNNPAVRLEMLRVMKFWLSLDVDGFRVDAVPYLYEREGTSCENLPETHVYLKEMRRFVEANFPGKILLCEANQWPQDVRPYFGCMSEKDAAEFHMAFNFPLMPRIFMALKQGESQPIRWAVDNTPPIPAKAQWCTFLRNHDELTLEMVTEEERQWMWQQYAPEPRMRLNLGIRRRLAPLLDNNRRKIELANSLLFSLPGTPIVYYGDEIGMGDNIGLPDRDGVRTPMQWDSSSSAGFSQAKALYSPVIDTPPYDYRQVNVAAQQDDAGSLWNTIRKMIHMHKAQPALGEGGLGWIKGGNENILAFTRTDEQETLLCVHNLTGQKQQVSLEVNLPQLKWTDLFTERSFVAGQHRLELELGEYQYLWMK